MNEQQYAGEDYDNGPGWGRADKAPGLMDDAVPPIVPGEVLGSEFMVPQGVLPTDLARGVGVPVNRITDILSGKRRITAQTALLLATYFQTSAEFWARLQMEYDLRDARRSQWARTHLMKIKAPSRLRNPPPPFTPDR